jgi:CRP-like cAMP-binding protein
MPDSLQSELQYLKTTPIFKGLDEELLSRILADSYGRDYTKDEYLFYQEDPAEAFYICVEGRIKLTQLTPDGNQVIMHYPGPGEVFGLIAVLRGIRFPVAAQAVEDSRVIAWKDSVMTDWMRREPEIALNAIRILAVFIENFQDRITELSTERVERRIARTLLRLAQQAGHKEANGIRINVQLTRQDLAEMAGTTLYTVSRTLSKWEGDGLLDSSGPLIRITNPHQLVNVADDLPQ